MRCGIKLSVHNCRIIQSRCFTAVGGPTVAVTSKGLNFGASYLGGFRGIRCMRLLLGSIGEYVTIHPYSRGGPGTVR